MSNQNERLAGTSALVLLSNSSIDNQTHEAMNTTNQQHSGARRAVYMLGLILGLVTMSQVANAQTWNGTANDYDKEMIVINGNNTNNSDAGIRFNARTNSLNQNFIHWLNWVDNTSRDMRWNYIYAENGSYGGHTSLGSERMKLTEQGALVLYGSNNTNMFTIYASEHNSTDDYGGIALGHAAHHIRGSWGQGLQYSTPNYHRFGINTGANTTTVEAMRIDGSGRVAVGSSTFNAANTYKLGVNGTGYFSGALTVGTTVTTDGIKFVNSEGLDFGSTPDAGTMMYDANWDNGSGDPEYATASYFIDGSGNDEDLGGISFWGPNATAEWEHVLTSYNMRYLKGDMYSLDLDNNIVARGTATITGNITSTSGTITGSSLVSNGTFTSYGDMTLNNASSHAILNFHAKGSTEAFRAGMNTAYDGFLWNLRSGADIIFGTNSGAGAAERMQITAEGYVGIGSETFNDANTAQLGVEGTLYATGNTTIGSSASNADLYVYGTAKVKELYIDLNETWADYVFEDDYQLRSLSEVEAYINENGHLPDVMSAEAVATEGYAITEVNATLLRKIEELTLYSIDLEKTNADSQERIQALEASNAELRVMLETILTQLEK